MKGLEVRKSFVEYFKKQGHEHVESSSLIPHGDDTLLFANAGMNQFKNLFLGLENRPYKRAVTSQKCVRAGGKHNDLENVGFTARHHTFFEMLGNFSFGDYFKKEAIHFAWELVTKEWQLPKDRLYVTVFREDDEAADIWHNQEGVPQDRIFRFDEKDNFWMMGDTGPCGPCSEIFFDYGPGTGCGRPDCKVGCSCDRYVEFWNLVFMQYEQSEGGKRARLPKPSVDTGAGLERLTSILQGKTNNYDTDLFAPLIEEGLALTKEQKLKPEDLKSALRVLADHARSTAFLIADGALPSNEGRGYVLRRIMRRGIRFGRKLNTKDSLLLPVVKKVIESFSSVYPELKNQSAVILKNVETEEARFLQTLDQGTGILLEEIRKQDSRGRKILGGETVFKLYDTFGFPVDLTNLMAREHGFQVDEKGFEELMSKARELAKTSWKGKGVTHDEGHLIEFSQGLTATPFVGYEATEGRAKVLKLSNGSTSTQELRAGEHGVVVLDRTPFYAESGGQVGDKGFLLEENAEAKVLDCQKKGDVHLHFVEVTKGTLRLSHDVLAKVELSERRSTARNHSATHLLHAALRKILGTHVTQAGSMVGPDRLRFDYTHNQPLSEEDIVRIEDEVNHEISLGHVVNSKVTNFKEAVAQGAMALFGEKYGDEVRVVKMGGYSTELCGGTHVGNTSDIRAFKIVSQGSVSAGVRRMEALTGDSAVQYLLRSSRDGRNARLTAGMTDLWAGETSSMPLTEWIQKKLEEVKTLEKQVKSLKIQNVNLDELLAKNSPIPGGKIVYAQVDLDDRDLLIQTADRLRDKAQSAIVILLGRGVEQHPMIVAVTKDLAGKYNAGKILNLMAGEMGGRGGGRPDFAQGAVKDMSRFSAAQEKTTKELGG